MGLAVLYAIAFAFPALCCLRITAHVLFGLPYDEVTFANVGGRYDASASPRKPWGGLGAAVALGGTLVAPVLWLREST